MPKSDYRGDGNRTSVINAPEGRKLSSGKVKAARKKGGIKVVKSL